MVLQKHKSGRILFQPGTEILFPVTSLGWPVHSALICVHLVYVLNVLELLGATLVNHHDHVVLQSCEKFRLSISGMLRYNV